MATANVRQRVVFEAQPGPQQALIACPIEDIFFGGARGGGKTYALLGDWLAHQAEHGKYARGIFFRKTYPELDEVQDHASKIYPVLGAVFISGKRTWLFPNGATLKMRYLERDKHADRYQGHAYTWMAFDELTNWASPKPIDKLRACLRSGEAPIPKAFRCSGNPGGIGHNWVKARYIDPAAPYKPHYDKEAETWRVFIPSKLDDNPALLKNDPDYWKRVKAATGGDKELEKAWRWGIWDIVAGGMFDDLWRRGIHVLKPFPIPPSWRIDRSFDWGSSAPFSVGWWAESDGTEATLADGSTRNYPRGTLFRIAEWYGWNGKPNEGIKFSPNEIVGGGKLPDGTEVPGIVQREHAAGWKVQPGPADSSIYDTDRGRSIGDEMAASVVKIENEDGSETVVRGVRWITADKKPGSRKNGWDRMRMLLKNAIDHPKEKPGLYVFDHCIQFIRTIPVLPRDETKRDDVDTKAEDHIADEARYRVLQTAKRWITA